MAKRILDYPEVTSVGNDDYVLLDNTEGSTKKIKATNLVSSSDIVNITQSDYNALSSSDQNNGKVYVIGNSKIMYLGDTYNKQ